MTPTEWIVVKPKDNSDEKDASTAKVTRKVGKTQVKRKGTAKAPSASARGSEASRALNPSQSVVEPQSEIGSDSGAGSRPKPAGKRKRANEVVADNPASKETKVVAHAMPLVDEDVALKKVASQPADASIEKNGSRRSSKGEAEGEEEGGRY